MQSDSPRRAGGFTLVELMVALVISGILVGVVLQILNGQTRFVAVQSGKEEAQQNVRGALEVIGSELRGAIPGALLSAHTDSLTFMQPRAWGLVCGSTTANSVDVLLPTTGALNELATGDAAGILFNTAADPSSAQTWVPVPTVSQAKIQTATVQGGPTAGTCAALTASGTVQAVRITSSNVNIGTLAAVRNLAVLYTLVKYDIAQVNGEWWLRRSNGITGGNYVQQPLAGPLVAGRFGFTYYAGAPPVAVAAPGTTAASLAAVRMIRVQVVSESSTELNGRAQKDSGAVTVMLRNQ